jgi:predicted MFS family arabinose efflux permease
MQETTSIYRDSPADATLPGDAREVTRLGDLSPQQWKSGIAAWLGWLFDGLDLHLYTLVATPFVAELLAVSQADPSVGRYGSWIQAAFLVGWAVGGGFFGRIGDRLGRARALVLTILTYALFTGLSVFAQTWWHLLICRFLAALGIGGEWAVGAALLSETWPRHWRPWIAAVLQCAVNLGILLAMVAGLLMRDLPSRYVFLVGILPALVVVWIRRSVPETEEWHAAKLRAKHAEPGILDLFRGPVRRITVLTVLVCAFSLTAHWAFMFWCVQHLWNMPALAAWTDPDKKALAGMAMILLMCGSLAGNFVAAAIARAIGYRRTIAWMCLGYFGAMFVTYSVARTYAGVLWCLPALGASSGLFGLFTMYLPPLFPTLLRTTGAGFCYNIGRVAPAVGTVFFGLFRQVDDYRFALLYASFLFLPAAAVALLLPELADGDTID